MQDISQEHSYERSYAEYASDFTYGVLRELDCLKILLNIEDHQLADFPRMIEGSFLRIENLCVQFRNQHHQRGRLTVVREEPAEYKKKPVYPPLHSQLFWTDEITGLVEVGYGFYAKGSFNHGEATLNNILIGLSRMGNIHLGNTSKTIDEMKRRKDRTRYMNAVIVSLGNQFQQFD